MGRCTEAMWTDSDVKPVEKKKPVDFDEGFLCKKGRKFFGYSGYTHTYIHISKLWESSCSRLTLNVLLSPGTIQCKCPLTYGASRSGGIPRQHRHQRSQHRQERMIEKWWRGPINRPRVIGTPLPTLTRDSFMQSAVFHCSRPICIGESL